MGRLLSPYGQRPVDFRITIGQYSTLSAFFENPFIRHRKKRSRRSKKTDSFHVLVMMSLPVEIRSLKKRKALPQEDKSSLSRIFCESGKIVRIFFKETAI